MELIDKELPADHKIFLFSDLHEGSTTKYRDGVQTMISNILAEKHNYAFCGGDICEGIMVDDKRYDPNVVDPDSSSILIQYQNAVKEMMPIKSRLLGALQGNHDMKLSHRGVGDFVRDFFCKELDIPYGTYSCKLRFLDKGGKIKNKFHYTHGSRSLTSNAKDPIQKYANMQATLKMRLSPLAGDCILQAQGHTHQLITVEPTTALYLADDGNKIQQHYVSNPENTKFIHPDHRWYANTGSFLKLYGKMGVSSYAERGGYAPTELGYIVVHIQNYKVINVEKVVV